MGFFPFAWVWIRSVEQILNSSMLKAEETTKVSAVDTFETGRFSLYWFAAQLYLCRCCWQSEPHTIL